MELNYKINCKYLLASCILINPHALVRAIPIQPCIYLLPPPQNTHPRSRAPFAEVWRFYCIVIESNGGYQWSETFELDMAMYVHSHITSHKITPNLDTGTRVQISAYYNETTHPRRYHDYIRVLLAAVGSITYGLYREANQNNIRMWISILNIHLFEIWHFRRHCDSHKAHYSLKLRTYTYTHPCASPPPLILVLKIV